MDAKWRHRQGTHFFRYDYARRCWPSRCYHVSSPSFHWSTPSRLPSVPLPVWRSHETTSYRSPPQPTLRFQPTATYHALPWPWRLKSHADTHDPAPQLLWYIFIILESARHDGFTLNVLARLSPPWTHATQRLIKHCLVHRILSHVTKKHTQKVPIPRTDDPFTIRPIILNHDWDMFFTALDQRQDVQWAETGQYSTHLHNSIPQRKIYRWSNFELY